MTTSYENVMIKCLLPLLLIVPLLIAPLCAAELSKADPQTTIEWVGKQRDEVIKLLGNTVGAYGKPIIAPGTGVVAVHRLKLFLDDKGYVYKTKVGKRVTK